MGIIVTIAMLFGLVILRPTPWRAKDAVTTDLRFVVFATCCLLLGGLWNTLWYGLRNMDQFWGIAALISGVTMILSAIIIFLERGDPNGVGMTWVGSIRTVVIWVLAACFLLYSVTLIQLNLGFPILR